MNSTIGAVNSTIGAVKSTISPAEALSGIPGWNGKAATWRELKGGLTNRTYLVECADESFVLRLDAAHTRVFNPNRFGEIEIQKQAAAAGLAPALIFADADSGILLSRYVPGRSWDTSDLDDNKNLEALADLLRRVHDLPASGILFDPNSVAKRYAGNLKTHRGLYAHALRCEEIIAGIPMSGKFRCCHNDVVATMMWWPQISSPIQRSNFWIGSMPVTTIQCSTWHHWLDFTILTMTGNPICSMHMLAATISR